MSQFIQFAEFKRQPLQTRIGKTYSSDSVQEPFQTTHVSHERSWENTQNGSWPDEWARDWVQQDKIQIVVWDFDQTILRFHSGGFVTSREILGECKFMADSRPSIEPSPAHRRENLGFEKDEPSGRESEQNPVHQQNMHRYEQVIDRIRTKANLLVKAAAPDFIALAQALHRKGVKQAIASFADLPKKHVGKHLVALTSELNPYDEMYRLGLPDHSQLILGGAHLIEYVLRALLPQIPFEIVSYLPIVENEWELHKNEHLVTIAQRLEYKQELKKDGYPYMALIDDSYWNVHIANKKLGIATVHVQEQKGFDHKTAE